jgi:hypothetical protein
MKQRIVGVLALILLAGIAVWVTQNDASSTMRGELADFAVDDTAAITRMVLRDESGNVIDLSRAEGHWILNDQFKARPDAVSNLLYTVKKVSLRAPISQQEIKTVLKNIIASHTLIDIYAGGGLVKSYYVGGPDRDHTGTFMLMKGSERPFVTHIEGHHGFLTTRYFTHPLEWRHRGVFELKNDQIASIELSFPNHEERDVRIERNAKGKFDVFHHQTIVPPTDVDSFMLDAYVKQYEMVHYESYEETKSDAFLDSVKTSTPVFHIEVVDRAGNTSHVTGFKKPLKDGYDPEGKEIEYDLDRLYLWINSEEMVIGQYAIFDKLTQGLRFFKNS